ncbi:hypothetical protein HPP92_028074 [Vanilla planifolia]|uniref:histidine kinase n=1 Tax=Vanilla planifolia TaxID=51239 RepID=A0A835PA16_VANPL|nr:hypothetical protein HPP92_028074 [Vanilla planifolia]
MATEDSRKMEELKVQVEAANIAKSRFLTTVSHEIRTPMNVVLAGKLEIEAVPFVLRSILDEVLSLFSAKSWEKGIELAAFVSNTIPEVLSGDPGRFRQILTNLVGNSVKFTERGHILVKVHSVQHSNVSTKSFVYPNVNGKVGVDKMLSSTRFNTLSWFEAADDRNCWKKFKLLATHEESNNAISLNGIRSENDFPKRVTLIADSSTSRYYGGTGIGLSISKCLLELIGGKISFISRPNVGSTFAFTVNLQQCTRITDVDPKRSPIEDLPACFKGMKVVLVDENPIRSAVTNYRLQRLCITVEVTKSLKIDLSTLP